MKKNQTLDLLDYKQFVGRNILVAEYGDTSVFRDEDHNYVVVETFPSNNVLPAKDAAKVLDVTTELHDASVVAATNDKKNGNYVSKEQP